MKAVLLVQVMLLLVVRLAACPAGYESPESLVRHARLIVQVEVLSVQKAPLPSNVPVTPPSEDNGRSSGQARVKILEVIKGQCAVREFTLIGGPYHTCAPYLLYHSFTVGKKLLLVLETPLPTNVKLVVVTWRNRVMDESVDHVRGLMEKARVGWKRALDRHRRAAPEEMAQAEMIQAELGKNPAYKIPQDTSFGVLSCLAVLWNDPDHLHDKTPEPVDLDGFDCSPVTGFYASKGAYITAYASQVVMPEELRKFFPKRNEFDYTPPPEAGHFNERMLKTTLEDELFVTPALTLSILKNPKLKSMWERPQEDPFWLDMDRPRRVAEPADAMALYYLMLLADPEPDGLVWGTFGMGADKDAAFLPVDLFVGFLGKNPQLDTETNGVLMILARLPHPKIAPLVRTYAAKGLYDNWPVALIRYFAETGSEPDILNAVSIMEKNVEGFIQSMRKIGRDNSMDEYTREHYQKEGMDALKCLAAAGSFETAKQRLNDVSKRLADVKIKAPQ